jgi:hypothetical protein
VEIDRQSPELLWGDDRRMERRGWLSTATGGPRFQESSFMAWPQHWELTDHPGDIELTDNDPTGRQEIRLCNFPTGKMNPDLMEAHKNWLREHAIPALRVDPGTRLTFTGFASKRGDPTFNRNLSNSRCEAVRRFLEKEMKVSLLDRIQTVPAGEEHSQGGESDNYGLWRAVTVSIHNGKSPQVLPGPILPPIVVKDDTWKIVNIFLKVPSTPLKFGVVVFKVEHDGRERFDIPMLGVGGGFSASDLDPGGGGEVPLAGKALQKLAEQASKLLKMKEENKIVATFNVTGQLSISQMSHGSSLYVKTGGGFLQTASLDLVFFGGNPRAIELALFGPPGSGMAAISMIVSSAKAVGFINKTALGIESPSALFLIAKSDGHTKG